MRVAIFWSALMASAFAWGAELETPHYMVEVVPHCAEGNVTCDDVTYVGKSKASGRSIRLKGATWHARCADGVTPCRFLGYRFENGNTVYYVSEAGKLEVVRNGDEVLLSEQGAWR